jgi:hypothetical protein
MVRFLEGVLCGVLLSYVGWERISSSIEAGFSFAKGLF